MSKIKILWVDDEIDMLKSHILFLNDKGYDVKTSNNGDEALDLIKEQRFDIIFLDEQMPGISGLETLSQIKNTSNQAPIVMITKSEAEDIMEQAIGANISDYLIKPVNPNQILLCIKKNLDNKELISKKTSSDYQQEFRKIGMALSDRMSFNDWVDIYKKIIFWELELQNTADDSMKQILKMQKDEANHLFVKFVEANYVGWLNGKIQNKPLMSQTLFKDKVLPKINEGNNLFLLLLDNLRFDQWKAIQNIISEYYLTEEEDIFCSILPTATQFARNTMFAGLLPSEIAKKYPQYWLNEHDEGTKNQFEAELLTEQLKRYGKNIKFSYNKILNYNAGRRLVDTIPNIIGNKFNVIVYNFVDTLSHARTEMDIIKELASDEVAYRSLTVSWFEHSPLLEVIKYLAERKVDIMITTDHGSVVVNNPIRVVGERDLTTNLRYKYGRNLQYNKKEVFEIKNADDAFLPNTSVSSQYIFARESNFFAYPNNYNQYVNMYRNSFQHGGISMEEMLIPCIYLKAK